MEVNWASSDSYHLTLCFLGPVSLPQIERLEHLARQALADTEPLQVNLNAVDYYPVSRRLALVAALSEGTDELMSLHRQIARVALAAGIDYQEHDFRPHVTLGRLPAENRFEPPEQWPALDLQSPTASVVLYQSKPGERGSIYTPLFEVPLLYPLQRARYA